MILASRTKPSGGDEACRNEYCKVESGAGDLPLKSGRGKPHSILGSGCFPGHSSWVPEWKARQWGPGRTYEAFTVRPRSVGFSIQTRGQCPEWGVCKKQYRNHHWNYQNTNLTKLAYLNPPCKSAIPQRSEFTHWTQIDWTQIDPKS